MDARHRFSMSLDDARMHSTLYAPKKQFSQAPQSHQSLHLAHADNRSEIKTEKNMKKIPIQKCLANFPEGKMCKNQNDGRLAAVDANCNMLNEWNVNARASHHQSVDDDGNGNAVERKILSFLSISLALALHTYRRARIVIVLPSYIYHRLCSVRMRVLEARVYECSSLQASDIGYDGSCAL